MIQMTIVSVLTRVLTVLVCWLLLMGLPLIFFHPPLEPGDLKVFLGFFYALLLFLGTVLARTWGGKGLLFMASPFLVLFTGLAVRVTLVEGPGVLDKLPALNFLAIYGVTFLAWRLGARWYSPAREEGKLL